MQVVDFKAWEGVFEEELNFHAAKVNQLENEIRVSKRNPATPFTSQHIPATPTHRAPPAYPMLRGSSPSPFGLNSPRRSGPDNVPQTIATEHLLEYHGLMALKDSVMLIMRLTTSVNWKDEVEKLNGMPVDVVNGLANAMHEDRYSGIVVASPCSVPSSSRAIAFLYTVLTSFKTIQAVSVLRARAPAPPPQAPLTAEQKREKRAERAETQANIDRDVAEWFLFTEAKAIELGQKYDKKPRYFLDIFFQGGAHMVNRQEKINPYNAFKAEKAAQRREDGETGLKVQELHEEYKEEYEALTAAEEDIPKICCDTPKVRVQDVANTVRSIEALFQGLSYRVGVKGFFCIVRNSTEFYMGPQWYFTSDALRRYIPLAMRRKWDTAEVGTRLEAFAVAGCDPMGTQQ
ncbi:hypothetical protein C8R45DRAFT_1084351 [Mycena sanguinolenta]|nr:hypothetical protein C8R45DRAFT_1084351 [Mycena sanguinolenta]